MFIEKYKYVVKPKTMKRENMISLSILLFTETKNQYQVVNDRIMMGLSLSVV